jgi:hypothetical protein
MEKQKVSTKKQKIQREHMEILEPKNTETGIKSSVDGLNSRIKGTDRTIGIAQTKQQRENKK